MFDFQIIRKLFCKATNGKVANNDVEFDEYVGVDALLPGIPRSQQLSAMIDLLGFTVDDLAQLGGVNREQIDDWLARSKGTGLPQLIDDVRAISRRMAESNVFLPEEIWSWFREPNHGWRTSHRSK